MSRVAAIHHPLCDVDPGAGNIGLFAQVGDFVHRPAVNSHPNAKFGMTFEFPANLQRAQTPVLPGWCEKRARRHRQSASAATCLLLRRDGTAQSRARFCSKRLNLLALLGDEQLRVTNDVDEQDMPDLKLHVGERLGWHEITFYLETPYLTSRISRKIWV